MNRRKQVFLVALLIIFTYILTSPVPILADGTGPAKDVALAMSSEPMTVTRVVVDDVSPYFLRAAQDARTLPLETTASAFYLRFRAVPCEVKWRYNDFDNMTPGRRVITGDVILPEGYVFEDEPLSVESVIIVYDDTGAPFIRVTNCKYTVSGAPVVLPLGASASEVKQTFDKATEYMYGIAGCYTDDGDIFSAPFTLDLSMIDTSVPGAYYPVTVELPPGMTFGGQEFWTVAAFVAPADEITLTAVGIWDVGYIVRWLYEAENLELWSSIDGGEWRRQSDEPGSGWHDYGGFFNPEFEGMNGLYILFSILEPGHIYRFQVQYDDNRFSDVLVLDFTSAGVPKASNEQGGDRTGIDRNENVPPAVDKHQPPPQNKSSDRRTADNGTAENNQQITPTASPPKAAAEPGVTEPGAAEPGVTEADAPTTHLLSHPNENVTGEDIPNMVQNTSLPIQTVAQGNLPDADETAPQPSLYDHEPTETDNPSENVQNAMPRQIIKPPALEYTDETGVTVSGARLKVLMAANPNYVTFLHNELWVSVPTEYLRDLNVADTDTFTVNLMKLSDDSFSVFFLVNNNELTMPFEKPFLISMEWNGGAVFCVSSDGIKTAARLADAKAIFPLFKTGEYLLVPADPAAAVTRDSADTNEPDMAFAPDTNHMPEDVGNLLPQAPAEGSEKPYADGFLTVILVGAISLTGVCLYFYIIKKRRAANGSSKDSSINPGVSR